MPMHVVTKVEAHVVNGGGFFLEAIPSMHDLINSSALRIHQALQPFIFPLTIIQIPRSIFAGKSRNYSKPMPRPAAPTSHPTRLPVGSAAAPVNCGGLELGCGAENVPFLDVVVPLDVIGDGGGGGEGEGEGGGGEEEGGGGEEEGGGGGATEEAESARLL